MLPTLFLSHGAPNLLIVDVPARRFLENLAAQFARPRAILVVSAHWETAVPRVNAIAGPNPTIHDFGNFDPRLFSAAYPAPGAPEVAARVSELLAAEGVRSEIDAARGLDHGAWVPLALVYPEADIPVLQLSVQTALGPAHHLALGRALARLREEGVFIIASGSFTHDLSEFRRYWHDIGAKAPQWVSDFADWYDQALTEGRVDDLLAYRRLAPFAAKNHPTEEHLLPIYVALGAAGPQAKAEHLHASTTYGVLRMDVYAFH